MLQPMNAFIVKLQVTSNRTFVGNKIVDHSDVVGALPVVATPTQGFSQSLAFGLFAAYDG